MNAWRNHTPTAMREHSFGPLIPMDTTHKAVCKLCVAGVAMAVGFLGFFAIVGGLVG